MKHIVMAWALFAMVSLVHSGTLAESPEQNSAKGKYTETKKDSLDASTWTSFSIEVEDVCNSIEVRSWERPIVAYEAVYSRRSRGVWKKDTRRLEVKVVRQQDHGFLKLGSKGTLMGFLFTVRGGENLHGVVTVPNGIALTIRANARIKISNCRLRSFQISHLKDKVSLQDIERPLNGSLERNRILLEGISGTLKLATKGSKVSLKNIATSMATVESEKGDIDLRLDTAQKEGVLYWVTSRAGDIRIDFPPQGEERILARTDRGRLSVMGVRYDQDVLQLGDGKSIIIVEALDGQVEITRQPSNR